ncbi:RNA polymerase sigma factor SigZ [Antarcticibacterium arcticum]|uniref:RNA polymerase sigma factor n=1 Tax=Antarcticibacterium arcticum TaxID=2585771 RepID=A0A5B8YES9_9FLAO|nr:RNA polymerase sigma factor SigZ [Antarcticibacterium arcticum]QED36410.1 RNA polymerase sigma factor SigZ [Antarcticibacterium arcticum]
MKTTFTTNCDVPQLWQEHQKELRNFILKRVKDRELTDDILQEVLMKVYNFCHNKSGVRNVRSWLFQIAQNTIIDHYRKHSKFTDKDIPEKFEEEENIAFRDALNYITPILNFLPAEYSIPLKLSDIDGLKQTEIAKKLNLSLPATKSRIQRGRQLLMAEFITCCHFEKDATGNLLSFSIKNSCTPLQKIKKEISE